MRSKHEAIIAQDARRPAVARPETSGGRLARTRGATKNERPPAPLDAAGVDHQRAAPRRVVLEEQLLEREGKGETGTVAEARGRQKEPPAASAVVDEHAPRGPPRPRRGPKRIEEAPALAEDTPDAAGFEEPLPSGHVGDGLFDEGERDVGPAAREEGTEPRGDCEAGMRAGGAHGQRESADPQAEDRAARSGHPF